MKQTYSDTHIHQFIKKYIESEGGEIKDVCEEYFTLKTPSLLSPLKYTYKPAIAHEKKIDLIATGSPAFNGMIDECLKQGSLCSVKVKPKTNVDSFLRNFFKDSEYYCEFCEQITHNKETFYFCTKDPKCFHKINNAKISKINITDEKPIKLLLFVYSVFFNNKLKKNEEQILVLLDEKGDVVNVDILNDESLKFEDSKEGINQDYFDKINVKANEILDVIIKNKREIFDLQIKKEIDFKLQTLGKKLDDEKLQKSISKKWKFNENEWKLKKESVIKQEKDSLNTFISVKFLNLLVLKTDRISFAIEFDNKASIKSSFVLGIDKNIQVNCPSCKTSIEEGFGTEDGYYLCKNCINQSIETGKIYSNKFDLDIDNTTKEYLEKDAGFNCASCKKHNSKQFEFKCNHDNSPICYNCFEFCSKCGGLFSKKNLNKSKASDKLYCPSHTKKCEECNGLVGIDELRICYATGKKVCNCTKFSQCALCEQEYSKKSLTNDKCPACNNLVEKQDREIISLLCKHNPKLSKTKKWLIGNNKLNLVVIGKGMLSDNLFVIKDKNVIHEKKLSLFNKIKGY